MFYVPVRIQSRNGNPIDAAGQELIVGDYVSYKATTRATSMSCGIITEITTHLEKNIKVQEVQLVFINGVATFQNLPKSTSLNPAVIVKINDFENEPIGENRDATNRDLKIGDFVALSDGEGALLSIGYITGFNNLKKKSILVKYCSLSNQTDPPTLYYFNSVTEAVYPKNVVMITGAEKNWVSEHLSPINTDAVMEEMIHGKPSGIPLNSFGNPV